MIETSKGERQIVEEREKIVMRLRLQYSNAPPWRIDNSVESRQGLVGSITIHKNKLH